MREPGRCICSESRFPFGSKRSVPSIGARLLLQFAEPTILEQVAVETVRRLTHDGFSYSCRTVARFDEAPSVEPILLVGGAFMDMCGWREVEEHLAPFASVITADLPGQGCADRLPPSRGAEFLSTTIGRMLDDIGVTRVNVVGTSYGGALAYVFAQAFPQRVSRMVLLSMAWEMPEWHLRAVDALREIAGRGRTEEFGRRVIAGIVNADPACVVRRRELVIGALESFYGRQITDVHVDDMLARARIQSVLPAGGVRGVPTLVVSGEYDHATPPREGRRVASTIAESWFATVREADHAVHAERPAEVADLVLRFLRGASLEGLPYLDPVERVSPSE